jgi:hypothetical protein
LDRGCEEAVGEAGWGWRFASGLGSRSAGGSVRRGSLRLRALYLGCRFWVVGGGRWDRGRGVAGGRGPVCGRMSLLGGALARVVASGAFRGGEGVEFPIGSAVRLRARWRPWGACFWLCLHPCRGAALDSARRCRSGFGRRVGQSRSCPGSLERNSSSSLAAWARSALLRLELGKRWRCFGSSEHCTRTRCFRALDGLGWGTSGESSVSWRRLVLVRPNRGLLARVHCARAPLFHGGGDGAGQGI